MAAASGVSWLTSLFKGMSAKDWGSILGGVGGAYGAYKQGKAAEDLLKLQKTDLAEEKERKRKTQARLDLSAENLGVDHRYDSPALPLR